MKRQDEPPRVVQRAIDALLAHKQLLQALVPYGPLAEVLTGRI